MLVYHLSKTGAHREGYCFKPTEIRTASSLISSRVCEYGMNVLKRPIYPFNVNPSESFTQIREVIFEWVRQVEFSDQPTRLSCMYGVLKEDELQHWQFLKKTVAKGNSCIYIFDIENPVEHDAHWLDYNSSIVDELLFSAQMYWRGEMTDTPKPEVLIPLPATIEKVIRQALVT